MNKQQLIHILDIILYEAEQEKQDSVVCSRSVDAKIEALESAIEFIMENMENRNV